MITRQHKKSFLRRLLMPFVAAGFLAYFGYHAYTGSFGIWAMDRLKADAVRLSEERDRLRTEREALEARKALNVMRPDEIVIPLDAVQQ